jgi:hypothetical protein
MPYLIAIFLFAAGAAPSPKHIVIRDKPTDEAPASDPKGITPAPLTDNEVDAMSAVVGAVVRTILTPAEKATSVLGRCIYRGGFCPGALIELKDSKGQVLASQSLASADGFVFSNLKPGRYNLEVSYPRYKLKPVQKQVSPGAEIIVEMTE